MLNQDRIDGSAVKSISCSFRGPDVHYQQPHGDSCGSPIIGSNVAFWCAGVYADRECIYMKYINLEIFFKCHKIKVIKGKEI